MVFGLETYNKFCMIMLFLICQKDEQPMKGEGGSDNDQQDQTCQSASPKVHCKSAYK